MKKMKIIVYIITLFLTGICGWTQYMLMGNKVFEYTVSQGKILIICNRVSVIAAITFWVFSLIVTLLTRGKRKQVKTIKYKYCVCCGKQIKQNVTFCGYCGEKQE